MDRRFYKLQVAPAIQKIKVIAIIDPFPALMVGGRIFSVGILLEVEFDCQN